MTDEVCTEEHEGVGGAGDVSLREPLTRRQSSASGRWGRFGGWEKGIARRWRPIVAVDVVVDLYIRAGSDVRSEAQCSRGDRRVHGDAIVARLDLSET